MKKGKILIFLILFLAVVSMTTSLAFASGDSTKYKTKTFTNNYFSKDKHYLSDEKCYAWKAKKENIYANAVILEKHQGSKTNLSFTIYNNNGNEFHHTDCRSSKMTINYKIIKDKTFVSKTKTYSYNKIPKYGMRKTITLSGPKNTKIDITSIKWSQTHRIWFKNLVA